MFRLNTLSSAAENEILQCNQGHVLFTTQYLQYVTMPHSYFFYSCNFAAHIVPAVTRVLQWDTLAINGHVYYSRESIIYISKVVEDQSCHKKGRLEAGVEQKKEHKNRERPGKGRCQKDTTRKTGKIQN